MINSNEVLRMIFGFKLRYLRLKHKKSYAQLSEVSGLSTSYLNDIEKGKKYPKPDKIELLAKGFGLSYDDLVSTRSDKKIQPIIDLINSDFFKLFPLQAFGMSPEKILDVFTNAPNKTNAFITTIMKLVRSYQIGQDDFYRVALRSYQAIHDNYFPELESQAERFTKTHKLKNITAEKLEGILDEEFHVQIDNERIGSNKVLRKLRSYYDPNNRTLYINPELNDQQVKFILCKELGFQYLQLSDRPMETTLNKDVSFEKLLNNFKASYFAIALLIPEKEVIKNIRTLANQTAWKDTYILDFLSKYDVTPEMFMQRLTNILPHAFGITDLFFIKLNGEGKQFEMTKDLHLSQIHNPYNNQLKEHLCHRWVSISSVKQVTSSDAPYHVDAQVSQYWEHPNTYFCISVAQKQAFGSAKPSSVTLGLLVNQELRATFNFIKDPKIKTKLVNTTCERCAIMDCEERVVKASTIHKLEQEERLAMEIDKVLLNR